MTEMPAEAKPVTSYDTAAWVLAGAMLILVLKLHLLGPLLSGFLVYELVYSLSPRVRIKHLSGGRAKVMVVAFISIIVILALLFFSWGTIEFFRSGSGNVSELFKKMAEILSGSHTILPSWLVQHLPQDADDIKHSAVAWLNQHAAELPSAGKNAARGIALILIGMVIGAIVSLQEVSREATGAPLTEALSRRIRIFHLSFRRIVFAQIRISALNTFFTWMFLSVALPAFDIHLPLTKTLVAITFIAGLLPIVGNLISNTVIFIVSMSISLGVAVAALVFLVIIHKLEYFLNAKIVGSQINSKAWELLIAMIIMEAAFGLRGLIAAPIYYAYLKSELFEKGMI